MVSLVYMYILKLFFIQDNSTKLHFISTWVHHHAVMIQDFVQTSIISEMNVLKATALEQDVINVPTGDFDTGFKYLYTRCITQNL